MLVDQRGSNDKLRNDTGAGGNVNGLGPWTLVSENVLSCDGCGERRADVGAGEKFLLGRSGWTAHPNPDWR
jgi:hypothetical protein